MSNGKETPAKCRMGRFSIILFILSVALFLVVLALYIFVIPSQMKQVNNVQQTTELPATPN
ncbi:MAG TPA: hypothetical protein PLX59_00425 [Candidatus Cloacimonadota bacterium]|nr:hypothetical protein [Candidatus Cloacimonadota bacterium]